MQFLHRLAYYALGLTIGMGIVYFIWEKKDTQFDYMPNARVLKDLRNSERIFSEEAAESLVKFELDSTDIANILAEGTVDFGDSKPRQEPCKEYAVDGLKQKQTYRLLIKKCDSTATIYSVDLK